jgi:hypothetical protein
MHEDDYPLLPPELYINVSSSSSSIFHPPHLPSEYTETQTRLTDVAGQIGTQKRILDLLCLSSITCPPCIGSLRADAMSSKKHSHNAYMYVCDLEEAFSWWGAK